MDFHLKWHFMLPGSLLHSSEMKRKLNFQQAVISFSINHMFNMF